jgi:hypothetical protein
MINREAHALGNMERSEKALDEHAKCTEEILFPEAERLEAMWYEAECQLVVAGDVDRVC